MHASVIATIRHCHEGAEADKMTFPQILQALNDAGIEGYIVDYRRSTKTCYQPDGESLELGFTPLGVDIAAAFDAAAVKAAILEAQTHAPGYSYRGFCAKAKAAGCAGYLVSLPGRRVVYFGRTGDTHVELFPAP